MRILFVSQFFPSVTDRQTGGTISNRNFLRCLAQHHEVTVLALTPCTDQGMSAEEPYRIVYRPPPEWRAFGLLLHWQEFVRQASQELIGATGQPDVLIATTSTLAAFDVAPQTTKCLAVIQAFENFGLHCPWVPLRSRIDLIKGIILRRFQDTRHIRRSDAVLTNSNFMRSVIADRFGIETARVHVLKQQLDFETVRIDPPPNTVGFVHRGRDKNIALVLELARRAPDLTFLIYGHSEGLPPSPPQNIIVKGWTSDRSEMFASAALWIVPSLWAEPFGRVSMEAQAADRPVLVANRGGLPETTFDDHYVIDDFSPEAWLTRMRQLLRLPQGDVSALGSSVRTAFSRECHDQLVMETIGMISSTRKARR